MAQESSKTTKDQTSAYTPITFDRFIRWTLTALGIVVVFLIVNYLSSVLLPFFVAWLFAYLLYPIVKFVQYKLHVPTRPLSIIVTMIFVFAIIAGIIYLIIPPMIDEFNRFTVVLTKFLHETTGSNNISRMVKEWIIENQGQIEHFLKSPDFSNAIKTAMPFQL